MCRSSYMGPQLDAAKHQQSSLATNRGTSRGCPAHKGLQNFVKNLKARALRRTHEPKFTRGECSDAP